MKTSKRIARVAIPAIGATLTALALSPTTAHAAPPPNTPAFDWQDCPKLAANHDPKQSFCFNVIVKGGQFKMGKVDKQVEKPIKMTYASLWKSDVSRAETVFGRMRSEPMLIEGVFGDPLLTAVYATPEYAGLFETPPIGNFATNINLKIKLTGRVLPVNCYIGSNSDPISLKLTTGTTNPPPPNTPITGVKLTTVYSEIGFQWKTATHVDNSFSAPAARGCGLINGGLLDTIINSQAGTPSAAGKNTMVFSEDIGIRRYDFLS